VINEPIISEYAQGLAQLTAGNLHTFLVRGEDILTVKNQVPDIGLYQSDVVVLGQQTVFGWKPEPAAKTPFRDQRLRQAYSMALDRDLMIDVVYNVSKFRDQGLPVTTRWSTALSASSYEGWWLDPKSKDFGENAKFFEHNIAEAKKLVSAAGYTDGVPVTSNSFTTAEYGIDFPKQAEVLEGMAAEAGFKFVKNIVNYNTAFIPQFRDSKGNFEGLSYKLLGGGADDAVSNLLATYGAKGGSASFYGFDAEGKGTLAGDSYVDDTLEKAKMETDTPKLKNLIYDLQRNLAKTMYAVRWPGGASGFQLAWPALKNFQVFQGDRKPNFYYWIDDTLPPDK
jgi:ABC-type transport system substrate-binding protein